MAVIVLSVRWTLPYLGQERFGAWMTIASFVGMLTFLDLGIGNALTNEVAKAAAGEDPSALTRVISGGLGILFLLGFAIGSILSVLAVNLPWVHIIKVTNPELLVEIGRALVVFSVLFGFNIFTSGLHRVFAGLQRSFEAHAVSAAGSIASLIALWSATRNASGIPVLLISTFGCQVIASFYLLTLLARRRLFRLSRIDLSISAETIVLLKVGGLFFILQVGTMVGWEADSLIIASTLGAAQVAVYSITQRLFQFVSQPLGMINAPLWGAYADAYARGDKTFIRRTLKRSMLLTAAGAVIGGGLLLAASPRLLKWWTLGAISVPLDFVTVFFIWTVCSTLGNAFAMMLNGCGVVREQVITVLLLTAMALPVKLIFLGLFGISGMVAGYTSLYLIIVLFIYGLVYKAKLSDKMV